MTGDGVVVWDSDDAGDDEQDYCAIVTPATEPWEIRCDAEVVEGADGGLRVGAPVRVEYERVDDGPFRFVATRARLLPYDPALLEPILRDVATYEPGTREYVVRAADHFWPYSYGEDDLVLRVVDDIQQDMHDTHADTTWPTCPRHPNHPMWYSDGWWRCVKDGAIVPLGELSRLRGA